MTAEIVKGLPIPPARGDREAAFPFGEMDVGDCLVVDAGPTGTTMQCRGYYSMQWFMDNDAQGRKFVGRKLKDQPGKVGIWRVE